MNNTVKRTLLLLTALLACVSQALALDAMPPGSLKAFAVAADNPRYIERWASSSPEELQNLQPQTRFAPGETAYTAVIITGYSRNSNGRIDLAAGFRFHDQNGKVLFRRDAYAHAQKFLAAESGFIMLDPALDIGFDPQDPPGKYLLSFSVVDNISQRRTQAEAYLTLDPQKYARILKQRIDEARILDELWRYYDQSRDLRALKRLASVLHWENEKKGEQKVLGAAAYWSLESRGRQDPQVLADYRRLLRDPEFANRAILGKIVEEISRTALKSD